MARFKKYLNEQELLLEANMLSVMKDLAKKPFKQIIKTLENSYKKIVELVKKEGKEKEALDIINRITKSRYTRLEQLYKVDEISAEPGKKGFVNWLKSIIFQGTIGASIFTSLQIFFSLDTIVSGAGTSGDVKRMLIYGLLWVLLASKTYIDWRHGYDVDQKAKGE
jgi:capsular polysaccharide biosynthesis protein